MLVPHTIQMRRWKSWELETKTAEYQFSHGTLVCVIRQFVSSVPKVDYLTLRHGFVIVSSWSLVLSTT
ncbi:hypothetical protein GW17_00041144 [Ensete ventricosum]|nr:hypothetical protein GW17_00041144 [Ensete ventricosum]